MSKTITVQREGRPLPPLSMKYLTRITRLTILPPGAPMFSERATQVTIEDESGGEFVKIEQQSGDNVENQTITVDPDEWPHLKSAVETLLAEISKHEIT